MRVKVLFRPAVLVFCAVALAYMAVDRKGLGNVFAMASGLILADWIAEWLGRRFVRSDDSSTSSIALRAHAVDGAAVLGCVLLLCQALLDKGYLMVPNRSASWGELIVVVVSAIVALVALPQAYAFAMLSFARRRTQH